jgi:hypothetical protein
VSSKGTGQAVVQNYGSVVFPRVGCAFSRPGSPFHPDAYSHGGISLPELLIPMVVLKVKAADEGLIVVGPIEGPQHAVEGSELEFRIALSRQTGATAPEEIRVEVEANYSRDPDLAPISPQVVYVAGKVVRPPIRFTPPTEEATHEERVAGEMQRTLTVTVSYREGHRTHRKPQTCTFTVKLNSE